MTEYYKMTLEFLVPRTGISKQELEERLHTLFEDTLSQRGLGISILSTKIDDV